MNQETNLQPAEGRKSRRGRKPLNGIGGKAPCVNVRVTLSQHATFKRLGGAPALRKWLDANQSEKESLHAQMLYLQYQLREARQRLEGIGSA